MKSFNWKSFFAALGLAACTGLLAVAQQPTTPTSQPVPGSTLSPAQSIDMFAFPRNGQSRDQQLKDESECYGMAKERTGLDPQKSVPTGPTAEQVQVAQKQAAENAKQVKGARVKGAARGTAGGVAIGAITGNTGTGAAVGAVAGTMHGGAAQKTANAQSSQKAAAEAKAKLEKQHEQDMLAHKEGQDIFQRAFSACMDARGYSVK